VVLLGEFGSGLEGVLQFEEGFAELASGIFNGVAELGGGFKGAMGVPVGDGPLFELLELIAQRLEGVWSEGFVFCEEREERLGLREGRGELGRQGAVERRADGVARYEQGAGTKGEGEEGCGEGSREVPAGQDGAGGRGWERGPWVSALGGGTEAAVHLKEGVQAGECGGRGQPVARGTPDTERQGGGEGDAEQKCQGSGGDTGAAQEEGECGGGEGGREEWEAGGFEDPGKVGSAAEGGGELPPGARGVQRGAWHGNERGRNV
jgi:hypothetical protein